MSKTTDRDLIYNWAEKQLEQGIKDMESHNQAAKENLTKSGVFVALMFVFAFAGFWFKPLLIMFAISCLVQMRYGLEIDKHRRAMHKAAERCQTIFDMLELFGVKVRQQ